MNMRSALRRSTPQFILLVIALLAVFATLATTGSSASRQETIQLNGGEKKVASHGYDKPKERAADLGLKVVKQGSPESRNCAYNLLTKTNTCFTDRDSVAAFLEGQTQAPDADASTQDVTLSGSGGVYACYRWYGVPTTTGVKTNGTCNFDQLVQTCHDLFGDNECWYGDGAEFTDIFWPGSNETTPCTHTYPANDLRADGIGKFNGVYIYNSNATDHQCARYVAYRDYLESGAGAWNVASYTSNPYNYLGLTYWNDLADFYSLSIHYR